MPDLLIAAGIFHPEPGGPATYLHEILPALQECGWTVRVVTYGDASPDAYPYPVTRIPRRFLPLRTLDYARAARPELAWADLVYAHTIDLPLYGSSHAPRLIKIVGDQAWERCIRRGWIPPETDVDDFQRGSYGLKVNWQQASRARQVRAMNAVIVPSAYLKKLVTGWGVPENNIHVIYNALPPMPEDLAAVSRTEIRQQLGWDDAPTILTAARLTRWKGVDHLMAALKSVPDARLMVAGEGDDLPRLRTLAEPLKKRVVFMGRLPREQLYRAMRAADVFALYSGYEGLPHTLLESLRVGTPILASEKGGNGEVVRHGENGLLVPYVNIEALADALRDILTPARRAQFSANAHLGMERFTFAHMVVATDATLRQYL